jgi:hypothetical protein
VVRFGSALSVGHPRSPLVHHAPDERPRSQCNSLGARRSFRRRLSANAEHRHPPTSSSAPERLLDRIGGDVGAAPALHGSGARPRSTG